MDLSETDLDELTAWRRELHRRPELSGEESQTASAVVAFLEPTNPDRIVTGLGGHGVAVVYEGREPGPTVMLRAELDGLPIREISDIAHRSAVPDKGHLCGHDGHMAILAAVSRALGPRRPARGRVILMFQPAEENGAGAAAVIADPAFAALRPDYAFALHNLPGLPLGHVHLADGPANCASRGMLIRLTGKTTHASAPEDGLSPMQTVSVLMPGLTALGTGGRLDRDYSLVTVTHMRMGEPAFGVAPADAELWVTLRTLTDDRMTALVQRAETLANSTAEAAGLEIAIEYQDVFTHCENHPRAVAILRDALDAEGGTHEIGEPLRASEDFGRFGTFAPSAMFFLGAGREHPQLHNPDYDFPDELIGIGARVFMRAVRELLG